MAGTDDLMLGLHELGEARPAYDDAWAFWKGDRDEEFTSPAVQRVLRLTAGRYQINVAKTAVVALANRLKIASMTAVRADGTVDEAADAAFQECLRVNKMGLQNARLIRNTLVLGDSSLFVWPTVNADGGPDGSCLISYNSPLTSRTIYNPEHEVSVAYHIKSWEGADGRLRATLYYPGDHLEKWVLKGQDGEKAKGWIRDPDAPDDVELTQPTGPLFHFRTDMPYGVPAHEDGYGAQDAVNKLSVTMSHSAEAAGFPQRYALTHPDAAINGQSMDNPDWDDDEDATRGTEDASRIRVGPGEIAVLEGIASTGTWQSASADGFISSADFYVRMFAMVTGTPMHYIDQRGQAPSGEAMRVMDAPLLARVDNMQQYLNDSMQEAMTAVLAILGYQGRRVDVRWHPPGVVDDSLTWQLVDAKVRNGVPMDVALAETGLYEADQVRAWLADASVEMDVARRVGILGQVATAMQGLSQGVSLGLLSEQQAAAVVEATIGQLTPELTPEAQ